MSTTVSGKQTITLWGGDGLKSLYQGLISGFEKKYPKITVKLETVPDTETSVVEDKVISGNGAPDLVSNPTGVPQLVKDGALTNLDAYAKAYGWNKLPAGQLAPYRVKNGSLGSGSLYEFAPAGGTMTGVFYNRALAKKIGITSVPTTLAEFQSDLAKAKSDGVTPIICANIASEALLGHLWNLLLGNYMGADALNKVVFDNPSASVDSSKAVEATTKLSEWIKDGYFNSDLNSLDQNTSYAEFMAGQGLFTIQGSWILQPLQQMVNAGNLGFFPLPPVSASGTGTAMSSPGAIFAIPSKSTHKAAAALFLNWTQSQAAAAVSYRTGYSAEKPGATTTVTLSQDVQTQISNGYAKVAAGNGFTNWVVNATPGIGTSAVNPGLQELAGGKITPAAFLQNVQQTYKAEIG